MSAPDAASPSPSPPPPPAAVPGPAPKPRPKRWKKIFLFGGGVIFGLILLILVLGPSIIASVAKSKITTIVAEQTGAAATVGSVSFSWSGHVELDDFRLVPKNFSDPLVEVKKIDVKVDVGSAIGGRYIAAVDVVAPRVVVEKGADGTFNYEFPPKPPEPPSESKRKEGPGKKLPFVQATLKVRDGEVNIRGGGRETIYRNLTVDAVVGTLEKPLQDDRSLESTLQDALQMKGGIDVDVAKFVMNNDGLTVSGRTHVVLKDGKISSETSLVVNKGKSDLNALLDFNPAEKKPQSSVTFSAKDVGANGQMGPLLEQLNPIFHTRGVDAKVDGVIQSDFKLAWAGVIDPDEKDWVGAASRSLSGSGLLGVQNLNIAGSPTVRELLSALGLGNTLQGELVATEIHLGNGQCSYENMTLRGSRKSPEILQRDQQALAQEKQDLESEKSQLTSKEYRTRQDELRVKEEDLPFRYVLRFTGVVRFDKRMELRVLMPMTDGMVKAHPHLKKYIGSSFWVDLKGTTEHPSLDMKKMLVELTERAAAGAVKEKLDNALKGLFSRQKEKDADKLFKDAQKSETEKKDAQALQSYQRLLNDYGDTDFVKKHGSAIQERITSLGGK